MALKNSSTHIRLFDLISDSFTCPFTNPRLIEYNVSEFFNTGSFTISFPTRFLLNLKI